MILQNDFPFTVQDDPQASVESLADNALVHCPDSIKLRVFSWR